MTIALIAHDGKKTELVEWAASHRDFLGAQKLWATGTTGARLENEVGLTVNKVKSGPLGGDLQIGALICEGKINAVIFLRDPLTPHPHEPDISALMKVCDVYNTPLATNPASAEMLIVGLETTQNQRLAIVLDETRDGPNFSSGF